MFYAVRVGRKPGIYTSWDKCNEQIKDFPQAKYKKFPTEDLAEEFMKEGGGSGGVKRPLTDDDKSDGGKSGPSDEKKSKDADAEDECAGWTGVQFDDPKAPSAYSHGICFMNGKQGQVGGLGVYWGADDKNNVSEKLDGKPTKNRAEIHAAMRAVKQVKEMGKSNVVLHTDCQFLINCAAKWMTGWKKKDWKTSAGEPVTNKEDLQELDKAMEGVNIKWILVKNKQGNEQHEAVAGLAKAGAKKKDS